MLVSLPWLATVANAVGPRPTLRLGHDLVLDMTLFRRAGMQSRRRDRAGGYNKNRPTRVLGEFSGVNLFINYAEIILDRIAVVE